MLFPELTQTFDMHGYAHSNKFTPLTEREIVAQSMTFLLAGYETTSASLAFFCHEMTKHPEVQDKIYQEIVDKIKMVIQ